MKIKILFFILILFSNQNAYAYIDPGIGSMLLQSLLVIFAAIATFFSVFWSKIKNFFSKKKENKNISKD